LGLTCHPARKKRRIPTNLSTGSSSFVALTPITTHTHTKRKEEKEEKEEKEKEKK
jgi:hypothetical protein